MSSCQCVNDSIQYKTGVFYNALHFFLLFSNICFVLFFIFIISGHASLCLFPKSAVSSSLTHQHKDDKNPVIHFLYTERRMLSNKMMLFNLTAFYFLCARLTVVCWNGSWKRKKINGICVFLLHRLTFNQIITIMISVKQLING